MDVSGSPYEDNIYSNFHGLCTSSFQQTSAMSRLIVDESSQ